MGTRLIVGCVVASPLVAYAATAAWAPTVTSIYVSVAILTIAAAAALASSLWLANKPSFESRVADALPSLVADAQNAAHIESGAKPLLEMPSGLASALAEVPPLYAQHLEHLYALHYDKAKERLVPSRHDSVALYAQQVKSPIPIRVIVTPYDLPTVFKVSGHYVAIQPLRVSEVYGDYSKGSETVTMAVVQFNPASWSEWKLIDEVWLETPRTLNKQEIKALVAQEPAN